MATSFQSPIVIISWHLPCECFCSNHPASSPTSISFIQPSPPLLAELGESTRCAWLILGKADFYSPGAHFRELGHLFNTRWAVILPRLLLLGEWWTNSTGKHAIPASCSPLNHTLQVQKSLRQEFICTLKNCLQHVCECISLFTSMDKGHPWTR